MSAATQSSTPILGAFWAVIEDGFSARAALGGAVGSIIMAGVRRAVFSNEAGLGSASMAHAAASVSASCFFTRSSHCFIQVS